MHYKQPNSEPMVVLKTDNSSVIKLRKSDGTVIEAHKEDVIVLPDDFCDPERGQREFDDEEPPEDGGDSLEDSRSPGRMREAALR